MQDNRSTDDRDLLEQLKASFLITEESPIHWPSAIGGLALYIGVGIFIGWLIWGHP